MGRYLMGRAASSLFSFFLFLTFVFFLTEIMIPHDFTVQFALAMNRSAREQLQRELGLDRPLWERYLNWLQRLLRGSLGTSFFGYPVAEHIRSLIPYTLLVFFTGTIIAFLLGQWLGRVIAWRQGGWMPGLTTLVAIALHTTFPPWLAFLMGYVFARRLGWFRPPSGQQSFSGLHREVWRDFPLSPQAVMLWMVGTFLGTLLLVVILQRVVGRRGRKSVPAWGILLVFLGLLVGEWFALGFGPQALDVLSAAGLPLLTYVFLSFGDTMLVMRTSMTEVLGEDYISAARAKGLPGRLIRDRHAARNALLPALSRLVISLPYLLTGLVIIEDALRWPGLSQALFWALYQQDMPTVMGALLLVGVVCAVARLALDLATAYLDPRVRHRMVGWEGL